MRAWHILDPINSLPLCVRDCVCACVSGPNAQETKKGKQRRGVCKGEGNKREGAECWRIKGGGGGAWICREPKSQLQDKDACTSIVEENTPER